MSLYGLVGKSLSHSFSPAFFKSFFLEKGLENEHSYSLFECADIDEVRSLFERTDLAGLNVTFPYKRLVVPLLDELSPTVKSLQAVNTVAFLANGKRMGYNTDVTGFELVLEELLGKRKCQKAVILGAGGAAHAVRLVLELKDIEVLIVSRSSIPSIHELPPSVFQDADIIVNCTPLGTYPEIEGLPDIPYQGLHKGQFAIDLVYNPPETAFLKKCKQAGCTTINGQKMLEEQARASWIIWEMHRQV